MSSNSTRKPESRKAAKAINKPPKPYPEFPLTPHNSGTWMKKIRGKIHYFGKWAKQVNGKLERIEGDGWKEALEHYKAVADDLHAGRTPRVNTDDLTVADLCNRFLTAKKRKLDAGEIGPRMFGEYKATTDRLVRTFGKTRLVNDLAADDFEAFRSDLARQFGPVRLGNEITRVKSVFKYAADNGLLERQVRFGSEFKKPAKAVLRKHKAGNGENMMEPDELQRLLSAAAPQLKAMVLLGLNCGFGPMDCATLPETAVDLEGGWVDFPRPKTGIARRCPLWPETIAALKAAQQVRPQPLQEAAVGLVFVTARGRQWISKNQGWPVTAAITALMKTVGVHREGRGPYTLRHVFRTIADGAKDQVAIDLIMGHADPSMGGLYRERVEDSRLQAVVEHVRTWLFGEPPDDGTTEAPESNHPGDAPRRNEGTERPTLRLFAG